MSDQILTCPHCRNQFTRGATVCSSCNSNISYLKIWTDEFTQKYIRMCRVWNAMTAVYLLGWLAYLIYGIYKKEYAEISSAIFDFFFAGAIFLVTFVWLPGKLGLFKLLFITLKRIMCGSEKFRTDRTRLKLTRFVQGKLISTAGRAPDYLHIGSFSLALGGKASTIKDTSTNAVRYIDVSNETGNHCEVFVPVGCECIGVLDLKL